MKAIVYEGTRRVGVREVEDAVIEDPTDVVVRVTSSAICGTDLHMYDGRTGAEPGLVIGHEPLGVIERAGSEVSLVKPGDRVVIPTHLFCGMCFNCVRGYTAACLRVRPGGFGAAYGYAGLGPYRGAQAELLRVPFADANCVRVPGSPLDELEDDLVLLADAFVTGWHATELAFMQPGTTVAVFGAPAAPAAGRGQADARSSWWPESPGRASPPCCGRGAAAGRRHEQGTRRLGQSKGQPVRRHRMAVLRQLRQRSPAFGG
jgi:glutathione-independent formaldehyde dehydrogenase